MSTSLDQYLNVLKPKAPKLLSDQELFDKVIRYCFNRTKLPVQLGKDDTRGICGAPLMLVNNASNGSFSTLMALITQVDMKVLQKEAGYEVFKKLGQTEACEVPDGGHQCSIGLATSLMTSRINRSTDPAQEKARFIDWYDLEFSELPAMTPVMDVYFKLFQILKLRGVIPELGPDEPMPYAARNRKALLGELLGIDEEIIYRLISLKYSSPGYFDEIFVIEGDMNYRVPAWCPDTYRKALHAEGVRISTRFDLSRDVLKFYKP